MRSQPPETSVPTLPESLIDRDAAAKILGVAGQTLDVWRCTRRYPLPYVKIGSAVRYRVSDLAAFIASRTIRPAPFGRACEH